MDHRTRVGDSGSWLSWHLEEFVKPVLGTIPERSDKKFFLPSEISVIKNMWRSVKREANGLPVLLAGRDVFIFEILARREHFPTTFRPDISRLTVEHVTEDYSRYFLFDTGFIGSIPRGLRSKHSLLVSSCRNVIVGIPMPPTFRTSQVFPRLTGSRSLALHIEATPKYWRSGFYRDPKGHLYDDKVDPKSGIGQEFSDPFEFRLAALLTIEIFTDSSPKFSEGQLKSGKKDYL